MKERAVKEKAGDVRVREVVCSECMVVVQATVNEKMGVWDLWESVGSRGRVKVEHLCDDVKIVDVCASRRREKS